MNYKDKLADIINNSYDAIIYFKTIQIIEESSTAYQSGERIYASKKLHEVLPFIAGLEAGGAIDIELKSYKEIIPKNNSIDENGNTSFTYIGTGADVSYINYKG